MKMRLTYLISAGIFMTLLLSAVRAQETEATRLLKARSTEFSQAVIRVTDGVYTAVGYSVQPVSMIIGGQ